MFHGEKPESRREISEYLRAGCDCNACICGVFCFFIRNIV